MIDPRASNLSRLLPPRSDLPIAAGFVLAVQLEAWLLDVSGSRLLVALVALGYSVPLAWRRRAPIAVQLIVLLSVALLVAINTESGGPGLIAVMAFATFNVAREVERRLAWIGLALPSVWFWALYAAAPAENSASDFPVFLVVYGGAWLFGRVLRRRAEHTDELAGRAEQLERETEEREQAAAIAERGRIARELHDVVSHSISVVAIQAQAVRRRLGEDQVSERRDLEAIETSARQAMAEMRRLFGILRANGDKASLEPQPGLEELSRLVEHTRAAGLPVEVSEEGQRPALAPGIDLAAYRIVQEALTNALKHAQATCAEVQVRYTQHWIELSVEDDGQGPPGQVGDPGYGLIGMRERVSLYGGRLEAGPLAEGGFRVHVELPVHEGGASR